MLANLRQLGYLQMTPIQAASLPPALAGQRPDRPGQDRQRQDGGLCPAPAGPPEPAPLRRAGAGAVPDARAGRPGDQEIRRLARGRGQHQGADPVRRQHHAAADGQPGARRPRRGRHAGPHHGPPAARQPDLDGAEHPGAGRGRPHARHGLLRRHRTVAKACPKERQTLLFSATYPEGIARLARQFLRQPQRGQAAEQHEAGKIRQRFYEVMPDRKRLRSACCCTTTARSAPWPSATPRQQCRDLLRCCAPRASSRWPCTARWSSASATRCWCSSPTAAARCWWPPTSPRAASTSTSWKR
jgi:ATP-independent RNA helicase DbpA